MILETMILETQKFTTGERGNFWDGTRREGKFAPYLCADEFACLFTIPAVKRIWITIYDRPTVCGMAIRLVLGSAGGSFKIVAENGKSWGNDELSTGMYTLLLRYVGKTIHVEVEYYEEDVKDES